MLLVVAYFYSLFKMELLFSTLYLVGYPQPPEPAGSPLAEQHNLTYLGLTCCKTPVNRFWLIKNRFGISAHS